MPLSPDEQRLLNGIEHGLRDQDPVLAAKLTVDGADRSRRPRVAVAHGCLWLGMCLTLIGFALVHEVQAAGVMLIVYGTGLLVVAMVTITRLHPPTSWFPRRQ
jgi:Protein of unknown function (DUF3040)